MTFTKRERQRGERWAWVMRAALGTILTGMLAFACSGCGEGAVDLTLHDTQVFLENGNAKGRMMLRVNGSPLSFNSAHSLGPSLTIEFDGEMDFSKGKPEPD